MQLNPVSNLELIDLDREIAQGNIVSLTTPESTQFFGKQDVVYTGIDINKLSSINQINSSFSVDFYLWMRYLNDSKIVTAIEFPEAIAYYNQQQKKLELKKVRINAPGGGRKPILNQEEEIGLCLFDLRHMPTFEVLGMQFGVSKTEANDTFHKWLLILRKILPASLLEQLENQPQNREMLLSLLEEIELLVDTTEQVRERPRQYPEQKKFYSGKQKSHND